MFVSLMIISFLIIFIRHLIINLWKIRLLIFGETTTKYVIILEYILNTSYIKHFTWFHQLDHVQYVAVGVRLGTYTYFVKSYNWNATCSTFRQCGITQGWDSATTHVCISCGEKFESGGEHTSLVYSLWEVPAPCKCINTQAWCTRCEKYQPHLSLVTLV